MASYGKRKIHSPFNALKHSAHARAMAAASRDVTLRVRPSARTDG
jgi:hypothetical protein